jgi:hypothetical protein
MMTSNIAIPSSKTDRQAVHSDAYGPLLAISYGMEIYIYLDDVSPETGSTEIWPGTHIFRSKRRP